MTLERAAAGRVRARSLMTEVQTGAPIAASYCDTGLAAHELNGEVAELNKLEDVLTVIVLANVVTIRQKYSCKSDETPPTSTPEAGPLPQSQETSLTFW